MTDQTFRELNGLYAAVDAFAKNGQSFSRGDTGVKFAACTDKLEGALKPIRDARKKYLEDNELTEKTIELGGMSDERFNEQSRYDDEQREGAIEQYEKLDEYMIEALDADLPEPWEYKPFIYADDLDSKPQVYLNAFYRLGITLDAGKKRPEEKEKKTAAPKG